VNVELAPLWPHRRFDEKRVEAAVFRLLIAAATSQNVR